MARIVILGCAGTGKTTLARRLAERTGAPLISLDAIWQPQWNENDVPEFRGLIEQAHAGEAWISEGNFALATFDLRLPHATLIIWLERSKLFCTWHAITRVLKPGEAHRIGKLIDVLAFIWRFDRINRPRIEAARLSHGPHVPVLILTGDRDINAFVSSCSNNADSRVVS
jgi:adenylate kinase family enzyme